MASSRSWTPDDLGVVTSTPVAAPARSAWSPVLVVVLVPLHTAANFGALAAIKRRPLLGECVVAVCGLGFLALALVVR
jgi:hypothetical protein